MQAWLLDGMSLGSAAAFMITGPATKITNLGAVKIVLGAKRFAAYLLFTMAFALLTGWIVNIAVDEKNYSHQLFSQLMDEDGKNGTQYYQILRVYLDCAMDSAKAAKALFIHRNTLLYRINHIEDVFAHPLNDPRVFRDLMLSSWVCAYAEGLNLDCEKSQS